MFVVHPGEVHSNHTDIGCTFRSMYVDPELVSRMASGITGDTQHQPFFPDAMVFDDDILRNYSLLCHSFEESSTTLERESLLLEILILLVDRHAEEQVRVRPPQKERKAAEKVREFIVEFHARNISLQELSSLVDLSPFHLTRVFTKEIGMPPHAFQTQVRVVNAKRLIRNGLAAFRCCRAHRIRRPESLHSPLQTPHEDHSGRIHENSKNVLYGVFARRLTCLPDQTGGNG